jgi:SAM-dependent methyltransferase
MLRANEFWMRLRRDAVEDYKRCILDLLEPSSRPIKLLDCGCDDGEWTSTLGGKFSKASLFGLEIVESRHRLARARGIKAVASDLNRPFPFTCNSFDVIHANQVIEHLANTDSFVHEVFRVLKPGGYALICTENLASWHNIASLVLGWQPFSLTNVCQTRFQIGNPVAVHRSEPPTNPTSWQHQRVFAFRGLIELFQEYDFEIDHLEGSGYYPLPNFFSKLDPRHAAFMTLKVRKPA